MNKKKNNQIIWFVVKYKGILLVFLIAIIIIPFFIEYFPNIFSFQYINKGNILDYIGVTIGLSLSIITIFQSYLAYTQKDPIILNFQDQTIYF